MKPRIVVPLLLESALLRAAGFRHGFSTRAVDFRPGGGRHGTRAEADTKMAAESVALALRFDPARLHQVEQVHGDRVVLAAKSRGEKADALLATESGDAVAVRVADCVPILLADPRSGGVLAVHAGWRGVVAGIIPRALEIASANAVRISIAAIGPCIGPCCFEVGEEVAAKLEAFIDRREGDKSFVDLRRAVRAQLAGVTGIEDVPGCTKHEEDQFFSHRRDGDAAGRHLAVIVAR